MSFVLGITGGIASGKSTFTKKILELIPGVAAFNADVTAKSLLESDPSIQFEVSKAFPEAMIEGKADRSKLRQMVFSDAVKREQLEAILHPRIRQDWKDQAEKARESGGCFVADIPLLFETAAEKYFDTVVVIGCSRSTQIQRLNIYRGIEASLAQSMIDSQMDLSKKISLADHLVWNEASLSHLEIQTRLFAGYLNRRYG